MSNCLYWTVANLPIVCLYKSESYIITAEGYRYEEGIRVNCLIHAAIKLSSDYCNNHYFDFNGIYNTSCIDSWVTNWINEREKEKCKTWDYSIHTYLLKDIKTKKFWKRMEFLGSPYNEKIIQEETFEIFNKCYGNL